MSRMSDERRRALVGGVRLEELPPAVRRRLEAMAGATSSTTTPAPPARARSTSSARARGAQRWRCHQCGELSSTWAAAERHADSAGHGRIELLLTTTEEASKRA
jgi:hypothetical protein